MAATPDFWCITSCFTPHMGGNFELTLHLVGTLTYGTRRSRNCLERCTEHRCQSALDSLPSSTCLPWGLGTCGSYRWNWTANRNNIMNGSKVWSRLTTDGGGLTKFLMDFSFHGKNTDRQVLLRPGSRIRIARSEAPMEENLSSWLTAFVCAIIALSNQSWGVLSCCQLFSSES